MIPAIVIAAFKAFGSSTAQALATEAGSKAAESITQHLEVKHSGDHEGEQEKQVRDHAWETERVLAKTAAQLADAEEALLRIREGYALRIAIKYFEDHPVRVGEGR